MRLNHSDRTLLPCWNYLSALGIAFCLAWMLVSCQDRNAKLFSNAANKENTPFSQKKTRLDLVEYFKIAEIHQPMRRLNFESAQDNHFFSSGWNNLERKRTGEPYCWVVGRSASIDFPLVTKGPLKIRLTLEPPYHSERPLHAQSVEIRLNGNRLSRFTLEKGSQDIDVEIPVEFQRYGRNCLELLPSYWYKPMLWDGTARVRRDLAVKCTAVEFLRGYRDIENSPIAASLDESRIYQYPNSVITFYQVLPKAASLHTTLKCTGSDVSPNISGEVLLSLIDEDGQETILVRKKAAFLATSKPLSLSNDLSEWAEHAVAINLVFASTHEQAQSRNVQELFHLEWIQPVIEGVEEVIEDKGIDDIRDRYNVVVILFDSLRADAIGPYGNSEMMTPALKRLAVGGVTFQNCFANTSWTRPSTASILTSLYPQAHRAIDTKDTLSQDPPYLPEILQSQGYHTTAILNNGNVAAGLGFGRGFDEVREIFRIDDRVIGQDPAGFTWENILLPYFEQRNQSDQPFFLYLHEVDPHSPYDPPEPFDKAYYPNYTGGIEGSTMVLNMANGNVMQLDAADLRYLKSLYLGEITYRDRYLGWILDFLEQSGLANNSLIIFLSDHGEEFKEHGQLQHGKTLFEEQLRVPLLLSLKGILPAGRRPRAYVELIDVTPTILDLLGIAAPPSMQGQSLLPYLGVSDDYQPDRFTFAHLQRLQFRGLSVRFRHWKLIRSSVGDADFPAWYLFNTEDDPEETMNLWSQEPVIAGTLRQLWNWQQNRNQEVLVEGPPELDAHQLDPEVLGNLRALGYVE